MEPPQTKRTPESLHRRLRGELKQHRQASGLTQKQVAEALDWHPSKIIRIESGSGDVSVAPSDVTLLLEQYGADGQTIKDLFALAREARNLPPGWTRFRDVYSPAALNLFAYEGSAATIFKYGPTLIPGLFQTEPYTRALLADAFGKAPEAIDRMVLARAERQVLLDREDHPEIRFIIDEAVIHRAVGGSSVMRHQLERLVELSQRPKITVQILPFAAGAHFGMTGAFTILQFPGTLDDDLLYLENAGGESTNRDDAKVVADYLTHYWVMEGKATSQEEFIQLAQAAVARL